MGRYSIQFLITIQKECNSKSPAKRRLTTLQGLAPFLENASMRGSPIHNALLILAIMLMLLPCGSNATEIIDKSTLKNYIERFNAEDREEYSQAFPNAEAWNFLSENIPLFECPDKEIEQTYYFRWWTFRKHLQQTPEGWVITEFLPKVPWGGKYNTINCAAGHHIREGRWLRNRTYVEDYIRFWLRDGNWRRYYSSWLPESVWTYCTTIGDYTLAKELLPNLIRHYEYWEKAHQDINGLFWQTPCEDGMEKGFGGRGYRPTINSYMYGNALAIAQIAEQAGDSQLAGTYTNKSLGIKKLVQEKLWNPESEFFGVREGPDSLGLFGWRVNNDAELTRRARPSLSVPQKTEGLNGGANPRHSRDTKYPHVLFGMGMQEWVQYDFDQPVEIYSTQFFAMGGGNFGLPEALRVLVRENGSWREVSGRQGAFDQLDCWNSISFTPATTDGLRVEFRMKGVDRETLPLRNVRELIGYTPWYFNLPDSQFAGAWKAILDSEGFAAPWGLTTSEQRHPKFKICYDGHENQWNGAVWPFATAQTLTALANLLNDYQQDFVDGRTYFDALSTYARSHVLKRPDGSAIPWIDENQNPFTGDWISRTRILEWEQTNPNLWKMKGRTSDRGKDYNHSTFCDLVINGLVGLRPQTDDNVVVNPLVPEGAWDYFCLERVPYHGRMLTILWDKTGKRYGKGPGMRLFADGKEIAHSDTLTRVVGQLP